MSIARPPCACNHPDAEACSESRHSSEGTRWRDYEADTFIGDRHRCECGCHLEDEDGLTAWDDKSRRDHVQYRDDD